MRQLPEEIGNLSSAEKFDLLDALWENLEACAPALPEEQEAELDYRVARYEQDPTNVIAWEHVREVMADRATAAVKARRDML